MGKNKKGFNWRARSQIAGSVDLSQAKLLEGKLEKNDGQKSVSGGGYEVGIILCKSFEFELTCPCSREAMLLLCPQRETNSKWTGMCLWWGKF